MAETTVWFRNPDGYARELVDSGETRIVWDRPLLVKKEIDPSQWAALYFNTIPWNGLIIGEGSACHIDNDHTLKNPLAVYPIWEYGESLDLLEDLCMNPVGRDRSLFTDLSTPVDERPVEGQDHVIVISALPHASSGPGRKILRTIKEIHEDFPNVVFHLHGMYSFRALFGMGYGSADVDPKAGGPRGESGKVTIPPGSEVTPDQLAKNPMWARQLGFMPVDLKVPRNRVIFNIKSACWAGKFWDSEIAIKTVNHDPDTRTPDAAYLPPTVGKHTILTRVGAPGDKVICNECSLAVDCKFYRVDSVCSVPKTEVAKLASFFGTRNSEDIIDGLSTIVKRGAERLDDALETEKILGDADPTVTRQLGQVFDQGMKLAKLIDPKLRGGAAVQVNIGSGGTAAVQIGDTRQIVAAAMRELEASGIQRADITPAMIEGIITRGMSGAVSEPARVPIAGTVVRPTHPDLPTVSEPVPRVKSS